MKNLFFIGVAISLLSAGCGTRTEIPSDMDSSGTTATGAGGATSVGTTTGSGLTTSAIGTTTGSGTVTSGVGTSSVGTTTGSGGTVCPSGFADCDGDGFCETDTQADPNNCGSCGFICPDGALCQKGSCPIGEVVALAEQQANPSRLALDDKYVYWTNNGTLAGDYLDGAIMRVLKEGGAVETLISGLLNVGPLAVAGDDIYFANIGKPAPNNDYPEGTVNRFNMKTGTVTVLAEKQRMPNGIAVAGDQVYFGNMGSFIDQQGAGVYKVSVKGGAVTQLSPAFAINGGLERQGNNLYWISYDYPPSGGQAIGAIKSVPLTGGVTTTVAVDESGGFPSTLTIDQTTVFWSRSSEPDGLINTAPLSGGPPFVLTQGGLLHAGPSGLAVDGTHVYATFSGFFSDHNGSVIKVPKAGGSQVWLGAELVNLFDIKVDAKYVFTTSIGYGGIANGAIYRITK